MSGLITAAIIAGGAAVYAGSQSNKAAKDAAGQMREGVETFDPIEPNAPMTVDWRRAINEALGFNLGNVQQRNDLARRTNTFNTKEAQRAYGSMQPYFQQLQRQIGQNALSYSRGELPQNVVNSIGRASASRGITGGFGQGARGGGGALGGLNLRNLGLTSLDLSKWGTGLAMNASQQARALSPNLFDPASLMVSPAQGVGYEAQNVGIQNEAARYWNQVQNQALMGNTGAQNQANTNAINTQLAGQLAQAQAIAAAGQSFGGAAMSYGGGGGYGANNYGAPQIQNATNVGTMPGYQYNPAMGYRPLV